MKMGKMAPVKSAKPKMPSGGSVKPHVKMRKVKPVPNSAFPASPMAFPPDNAPPSPDQSIGGPSSPMSGMGASGTGASPGAMGG